MSSIDQEASELSSEYTELLCPWAHHITIIRGSVIETQKRLNAEPQGVPEAIDGTVR